MSASAHAPVLLAEAIAALAPADGGRYVDATFGAGGYSRAILLAAGTRVLAFDRDPRAIAAAADWAGALGDRLQLIARPFAEMAEALAERGVSDVDGVAFDLGVSSMQLDEADRGFSFRLDGPLSMRMDGGKPDAADVVNRGEKADLVRILSIYGEERRAGRIAAAIIRARAEAPIRTTGRLAAIVAAVAPAPGDRIHPATRAFQALRIFVNDELGQLVRGLIAAERVIRASGRLVVVTFHSLEDRIVKQFLVDRSGAAASPSRHAPAAPTPRIATFRPLNVKPITPGEAEIAANPRARSAKLRAAVRLDAPARLDADGFMPPPLRLSRSLQDWR